MRRATRVRPARPGSAGSGTEASGVLRRGFTLIEVLAVVLLTSIVLAAAVTFYVNLSQASQAASDHTRGSRLAAAVADRVARDLEASVLVVKPSDMDPIEHPWLFYAERRGPGPGSDTLKFDTRGHRPRGTATAESDLAVVAYVTRETPDGLELWRWTSPRLPDRRDRDLPRPEDPGTVLLADGLASFGVRLLDDQGQWTDSWDSTLIERSSQLPVAAEVAVGVEPPADAAAPAGAAPQPEVVHREVLLPVRPLDLELLLTGKSAESGQDQAGDDEDKSCVTVAQCIQANRALADSLYGPEQVEAALQQMGDICVKDSGFQVPAGAQGCQ